MKNSIGIARQDTVFSPLAFDAINCADPFSHVAPIWSKGQDIYATAAMAFYNVSQRMSVLRWWQLRAQSWKP